MLADLDAVKLPLALFGPQAVWRGPITNDDQ